MQMVEDAGANVDRDVSIKANLSKMKGLFALNVGWSWRDWGTWCVRACGLV